MEQPQHHHDAEPDGERAATVLASIYDLYGFLDTEGRVLEMHGDVFSHTATDPAMLGGQQFAETVYWQSSKSTAKLVANGFRDAAAGNKADVVLDFRASADQRFPMELVLVPLSGERNGTIFVGGRILSGPADSRPHSKGSEELLYAASNADIGLWYWNFKENEIYSTPQCNELLGLPAYEPLTIERFLAAVHPEDRESVREFIAHARRSGTRYEEEFRIVHPDGEVEWICVQGKSMLDSGGGPSKMMGVVRSTTEQKKSSEELARVYEREKRARDEAVEANRAKDFFLAFVSHELRAPLNAILGWSKILLTKEVDEKTRRNALETIERSASSQAKLINDLVDSARVASGRLRLEYRPTNLYELVRVSCQAMEPTAHARNIELAFEADRQDVIVFGDANRLQQVFGNLISNAIKFTQPGGNILVSVATRETWAEISVEDNGRGISPETLPGIFRQFTQGDVETKGSAGLGLGLSIAKILAEKHGGSIEVESAGIGQGSRFTVTLPLSKPEAVREKPAPQNNARSKKPLAGTSLLVVEDDPDSREVLVLFLEQNGAKVTSATNARAAYNRLLDSDGNLPDVIISDLAMPEEDGYSLISRIRQLPRDRGGRIPAIVLSAFATNESRTKAFEAGFQRYTTKPFDPDNLVREVLDVLQSEEGG